MELTQIQSELFITVKTLYSYFKVYVSNVLILINDINF